MKSNTIQVRLKSKYIQNFLGTIFLGLGGWALFFPTVVERLGFREEYYVGTLSMAILISCFGAQAVLCSILIFFSDFRPRTFLIFGVVGSFPFFFFNYYFVYVTPVFNNTMGIDLAGNLGILACGILGWKLKQSEQAEVIQTEGRKLY